MVNVQAKALCQSFPEGLIEQPPIHVIIYHTDHDKERWVYVGSHSRESSSILRNIQEKNLRDKDLSEKKQKTLSQDFGEDFVNALGLRCSTKFKLKFIPESIHMDDAIEHIYQRIREELGQDLYMWTERKVVDRQGFNTMMLASLFKDRMVVPATELQLTLSYVTKADDSELPTIKGDFVDYDTAKMYLDGLDAKTFGKVYEPLRFKYMQNNAVVYFPVNPTLMASFDAALDQHHFDWIDERAHTLEQHTPHKNTIYVVTRKYLDNAGAPLGIYIPQQLTDVTKSLQNSMATDAKTKAAMLDDIQSRVLKMGQKTYKVSSCSLKNVILRVNEGLDSGVSMAVDLSLLFKDFSPNEATPFMKYASLDGILYKLDKRSLMEGGSLTRAQLQRWTKVDGNLSTRKTEFIMFRVWIGKHHIAPYFATVVLYKNLMYDVRFQFSTQEVVHYTFVKTACAKVNDLVQTISSMLKVSIPLVDVSAVDSETQDSYTRFIKSSTISDIKPMSNVGLIDVNRIMNVISSYDPVFSVIKTKSGTAFAYRRVSDFASAENISAYVKRYSASSKDKKLFVQKVSMMFGIPADVALEYVNAGTLNTDSAFITRNRSNIVVTQIKITPNSKGYRVDIDGLLHPEHNKRILMYLTEMIHYASQTKGDDKTYKKLHIPDLAEQGGEGKKKGAKYAADSDGDSDGSPIDLDDVDFDVDELLKDVLDAQRVPKQASSSNSEVLTEEDEGGHEHDVDQDHHIPADFPINRYVFEPDAPDRDKKKLPDTEFSLEDGKQDTTRTKKSREMLDELYKADPDLFKPPTGKGNKEKNNYATKCQMTHRYMPRQPVVVRPSELLKIKQKYPGSVRNWIAYGSSTEQAKKNVYFCPEVWCPKSRIAMTGEQFMKAGHKCPASGEVPVSYYQSKYFFNKNMYVGLMPHPDKTEYHNHCVPCCFIRLQKEKETCPLGPSNDNNDDEAPNKEEAVDKERYIMKDKTYPLTEHRYGLLPPALSKFLGNKEGTAGTGSDGAGHMSKKTNAFLRKGIPYRKQSFLQCMASILNNDKLKSDVDVLKAIKQNLKVEDFLTTQGGLLFKRFMLRGGDAIKNVEEYNAFKVWFLKQESYLEKFGLAHVSNSVWTHVEYSPDMPNALQVLREFVIYKAFTRFIAYLENDSIVKTHDVLLHLFLKQQPWLNASGSNLIVFDCLPNNQVVLSCYPHKAAADALHMGHPFILIAKHGATYEPIHHVKIEGASLKSRFRFDVAQDKYVARAIEYFKQKCKRKTTHNHSRQYDPDAFILQLKEGKHAIRKQVVDLNMQAVGFVFEGDIFVPLPEPCPLIDALIEQQSVQCVFIDTMYATLRPSLKKSDVLNLLSKIAASYGEPLNDIYGVMNENDKGAKALYVKLLKTKDQVIHLIPLSTMAKWEHENGGAIETHLKDLHIFVRSMSDDPRKEYVDMSLAVENLYLSVRNQIIEGLAGTQALNKKGDVSKITKELEFLRHPRNPLPLDMKRKMFFDLIDEKVLRELLYVREGKVWKDQYVDTTCSLIQDKTMCNAQCSWVVKDFSGKKMGACRLRVPKDLYTMVVSRAINDIVNPYVKLQVVSLPKEPEWSDNVILFSEWDLAKLDEIIDNAIDEDIRHLGISKHREVVDAKHLSKLRVRGQSDQLNAVIASGTKTNVHSEFRTSLKGFNAVEINGYGPLTLYDWFAGIYNRMHRASKMTGKSLKNMVKAAVVAEFKKSPDETKKVLHTNSTFVSRVYTAEDLEEWYDGKLGVCYPGNKEIATMAKIIGVDVLLVQRARQEFPDTLRCLTRDADQRSNYILMLQQMKRDKELKYERYDVIVNKDDKYLFETIDMNPDFRRELSVRCKVYRTIAAK